LKILMVVTYYEPHVSGLTIYVERIGEELARRGHKVTVLTSRHLPGLPAHENIRGVEVVRLPVAFRLSKGVIMPSLPLDAIRLVRQHDVVHMHLPLAESPYIAMVAGLPQRKRSIITYHCDLQLPKTASAGAIVAALNRLHWLAGRQVDALVTYTRDYATNSRFLPQFASKVFTVYPPIVVDPPDPADVARWRSELGLDGCKLIGFAGRFSEDKGGNYILGSIPEVLASVPNVRYVFAGEYKKVIGENFFEKVKPLVERYRDQLLFLGELHGKKLSNFYSMIDVLTLPSVNSTESFGMVQVEAMLCGTPVVASDIPGVREATRVSGMGMTVSPRDSSALAGALVEVLLNREKYATPKIDLARTFSAGQTVDFYERLYAGES
jgi:glycosyltransferase involved in cell wall biosynthesis